MMGPNVLDNCAANLTPLHQQRKSKKHVKKPYRCSLLSSTMSAHRGRIDFEGVPSAEAGGFKVSFIGFKVALRVFTASRNFVICTSHCLLLKLRLDGSGAGGSRHPPITQLLYSCDFITS